MTAPLWDPTSGTAADLLAELHARGLVLYVEDGRLRWHAPQGAMSVELLKRIKALEPDLVVHVGALQDIEEQGN